MTLAGGRPEAASFAARPASELIFLLTPGAFIRWRAWTTEVSGVRSQGGSWLGSGGPKVSRKSEVFLVVHWATARVPGGAASKDSGTPVMSVMASRRTSALGLWR